jgi:hypothetical protein
MVTIDTYATGYDADGNIVHLHPSHDANISAQGQSFTGLLNYLLQSCQFYMYKNGSPVGHLQAYLNTHNGTWGTDGVPTGADLAASNVVEMATLGGGPGWITFTFPTPYKLAALKYCLNVRATEVTTLDAGNSVWTGSDSSAPAHGGNTHFHQNAAWASNSRDTYFVATGALSQIKGGNAFAFHLPSLHARKLQLPKYQSIMQTIMRKKVM